MRKTVLALMLALFAILAGIIQAPAMEGFDLGDMPPLPPPLLDDSSSAPPSLTPPPSGSASPLVQGDGASGFGGMPLAPPPAGLSPPPAGLSPPASSPQPSFNTLMPPPPPLDGGSSLQPPPAVSAAVEPGVVPVTIVSADERPLPGKITGGRVNVRAGPHTQYESIAVLTTGAPVTVLAKNGEWYKIIYPADQLASIHKNYVTAEISGDIPEAGLPGVVNQNGADVHAFYWDKSTVVGKLNQGDPVVVKQERGQWYRIAAPETARAYVHADYVRLDGGTPEVAVDSMPPPENPNIELGASGDGSGIRARLSKDDERLIALKEAHFKRMREAYYQNQEDEEAAAREAAERLARQAVQLESALEDLDARLKAIDEETGQRIGYINDTIYGGTFVTTVGSATWAPPDPAYGGFTGWVENIGRVGGAPATHRLTKGGEIRFFLRSNQFNLDDFAGRRVWVNGPIEPAAGGSAAMLNVENIRILTELEIAEGGGGYQDSPYGAPVQASPYDASYDVYGQQAGGGYSEYEMGAMGDSGILPDAVGAGAYPAGQPMPAGGPVFSDASQLPDVVGMGGQVYVAEPTMTGSMGEVDSDFYELPAISEIAP